METKSIIEKVNIQIPEFFYDIIAYVLPGIILLIGYLIISNCLANLMYPFYSSINSSFDKFILFILAFFFAYLIGKLITDLSAYFILALLGMVAYAFKLESWCYSCNSEQSNISLWFPWQKGFDRNWSSDFVYVRLIAPHIGLELTKRYAWLLQSRNTSFVCMIISLVLII